MEFTAADASTYRQYAYLSITGYGPSDVITQRLGIQPSDEFSEGDPWRPKPPFEKRFFTSWRLNSGIDETQNLNLHIKAILRKLSQKHSEMLLLGVDYDTKIVCVSYNLQAFSFELDFELQRQLTQYRLRTWFDAYIDHSVHETIMDLRQQLSEYKKL